MDLLFTTKYHYNPLPLHQESKQDHNLQGRISNPKTSKTLPSPIAYASPSIISQIPIRLFPITQNAPIAPLASTAVPKLTNILITQLGAPNPTQHEVA
jgi:hypothetical protein